MEQAEEKIVRASSDILLARFSSISTIIHVFFATIAVQRRKSSIRLRLLRQTARVR